MMTANGTPMLILGIWADLLLIAPASANTLAKWHTEYVTICCLPLTCQSGARYDCTCHGSGYVQSSCHHKKHGNTVDRGNIIIEPSSGELASGLSGKGRMEEPENIKSIISFFTGKLPVRRRGRQMLPLQGKKNTCYRRAHS
jgi:phosphopantothenoylcysteine decarboxylase / phosphopantothenate---cysteine ligase